VSEQFTKAGEKFAQLVAVMARLRAPGGCPWDRKQTFDTIKSYLLEEAYEVMDAIDRRDWAGLEEELGDLLLQPVFFAEMAREQGLFSIDDSIDAINEKLIRRHPHVFGNAHAETPEDVKVRWDEIKKQEKAQAPEASVLDSVPRNLPALMEAEKIGQKAAATGPIWLTSWARRTSQGPTARNRFAKIRAGKANLETGWCISICNPYILRTRSITR